ncbi:MAG: bifunctional UDP-sugar hydrolase/5'-nucleotidase [Bdellovibrionales bacterium]
MIRFCRLYDILVFCILVASSTAFADTKFTILHTSDLHSHFTSRQSVRGLGGFARLKTKIDQLRQTTPNTLLLDAGDWSEGNIFFTLDSGAQTQTLLQTFNYDALVLGNHDWLVGPNELYDAFLKANMKTPVISANLNFQGLSPQVPLEQVIKPYTIKYVGGKKIGILGLSTFQVIFDHFFAPVKIVDPFTTASNYVQHLRAVERCDVVIALTHLGYGQDKMLARIPGIDVIIGGHSHLLLKEPFYQNHVPIFHVGKWGEFLGEYEFNIADSGAISVTRHTLHHIDSSVPANPQVMQLVGLAEKKIEQQFGGPIFSDNVVFSEVELAIANDLFTNDWLGQLSVDALREVGQTDVAFDTPMFSSSDLLKGWNHTADLFNLFPHVYQNENKKAWTILTYNVRGYVLRALMSVFAKAKLPLKMSNLEMVIDHNKTDPIVSIKVGGQPLSLIQNYSISSTRGILDFFLRLREMGVPIGPKVWNDTGYEAWRVVANKLKSRSPITRETVKWKGSVRSLQPDLAILPEFVWVEEGGNDVRVKFRVHNSGLVPAEIPQAKIRIDLTPDNLLDEKWKNLAAISSTRTSEVPAGGEVVMEATWLLEEATSPNPNYPMQIEILPVPGENINTNNMLETTLRLITFVD